MKQTHKLKPFLKAFLPIFFCAFSIFVLWYAFTHRIIFNSVVTGIILSSIIAYFILQKKGKQGVAKLILMLIYLFFFFAILLFIIKLCGLIDYLSSIEKLQGLIQKGGALAPIIFISIQIVQVVVSPIPALATTAVGAICFGALLGFVYSSIGVVIGSIIAFIIGRLFGKSLVKKIVGAEEYKKYRDIMNKKGKFLLPIVYFLPYFPDDIICMLAGITSMKFLYFLLVTIIVRPISICISSYLMSGDIIPFTGWGIAVWIALFIVSIVIIILVLKYQTQIDNWLKNLFKKKKSLKK